MQCRIEVPTKKKFRTILVLNDNGVMNTHINVVIELFGKETKQ